jgi:hypothetical protein
MLSKIENILNDEKVKVIKVSFLAKFLEPLSLYKLNLLNRLSFRNALAKVLQTTITVSFIFKFSLNGIINYFHCSL